MKKLLIIFPLLMFLIGCPPKPPDPPPLSQYTIIAKWNVCPLSWERVAYYISEIEKDTNQGIIKMTLDGIPENTFSLLIKNDIMLYRIRARVAGVDYFGRLGPWSRWSDWYEIDIKNN